MSDFMPTHWWHLAFHGSTATRALVEIVEPVGGVTRVRTENGGCYVALSGELTPMHDVEAAS